MEKHQAGKVCDRISLVLVYEHLIIRRGIPAPNPIYSPTKIRQWDEVWLHLNFRENPLASNKRFIYPCNGVTVDNSLCNRHTS